MVIFGLLSGVVFVTLMGAVLFGSAGRCDLPLFWAYLGVWTVACLVGPVVVDPSLIKERVRPGPGGQDYLTPVAFSPAWLGQHAVAGLDVGRFHWSDGVPLAVEMLALLVVVAALAIVMWAAAVNRFFSSVIRIQADRGHHLVRSGPYGYVRHPAYAVAPFLLVGEGLALGSWLAALLGVFLVLPILRRTVQEDRVLSEQLEGYAAYAEEVRYRLYPGIW